MRLFLFPASCARFQHPYYIPTPFQQAVLDFNAHATFRRHALFQCHAPFRCSMLMLNLILNEVDPPLVNG